MRVVLDSGFEYSSDAHPWFLELRSSRTNPKRDWYVVADGVNGGPQITGFRALGGQHGNMILPPRSITITTS